MQVFAKLKEEKVGKMLVEVVSSPTSKFFTRIPTNSEKLRENWYWILRTRRVGSALIHELTNRLEGYRELLTLVVEGNVTSFFFFYPLWLLNMAKVLKLEIYKKRKENARNL